MKAGDLVRWVALGGASAFGIVINPPRPHDQRVWVLTSDGEQVKVIHALSLAQKV